MESTVELFEDECQHSLFCHVHTLCILCVAIQLLYYI